MKRDVSEKVTRFYNHMMSHLNEVATIQTIHDKLYRGLIYVAFLDALAGAVMPYRTSNRDRFISFIQRFCHWSDGSRVSISHLTQLVRRNPDPAFEALRIWALNKFEGMRLLSGQIVRISSDPTFDEVRKEWPGASKEIRTLIDGVSLESLQHFALLYSYRNSLVHELRELGYGMDFIGDDEVTPYYHGMSTDTAGEISETAELVYPHGFVQSLSVRGLENVRTYLLENSLDPYDSFKFGTYWVRALNL